MKRNSTSMLLLLSTTISFIYSPSSPGGTNAWSAEDIRIGFNAPISGAGASEGANQLKAAQLAVKHINEAGGIKGRKVQLIVEDNKSTPEGAVDAYQKLATEQRVRGVVGPMKSSQIVAMLPGIAKAGLPTVIGGTNPKLTNSGNPWVFRVRPDDSINSAAMVKYLKENTLLTKVGILHDSDAFGSGGANFFEKSAKDAGFSVVKRVSYKSGERDFTAPLKSILDSGAQVLVVYSTFAEDSGYLEKAYRALGAPVPFLGSAASVWSDALKLAKGDSDGFLAVTDFMPGQTDEAAKYGEAFKKEYHQEVDTGSAWAYDGIKILASAIGKAGEDHGKVRNAILELQNYHGVQGTFSFSPNGDGLHGCVVVKIDHGDIKLVKKIEVSSK